MIHGHPARQLDLEETIRVAVREITLNATTFEIPERPPVVGAAELTGLPEDLRLVHFELAVQVSIVSQGSPVADNIVTTGARQAPRRIFDFATGPAELRPFSISD
jgi:hypothetical protein